uniref:Protein kinase domain-containing protein n=1 Tax=Heterorhabditis bacteriophora TaxID=37862 RepID=A0A1I7W8Z4_HETBA
MPSIERNWDERVLDMMRDFEKNMQRTNTTEKRGDVMMAVSGHLSIDSIRLESILTDLYVSLMIQMIELTQDHNICGRRSVVNQDFDTFHVKLRKASLALMESDNLNQNLHIINCLLHESSAVLHSIVTSGEIHDQKVATTLRINLGAIEGELPMAAHSLHDVVMRHGPQVKKIVLFILRIAPPLKLYFLEQQLNRLSAHPPVTTNPLLPTISISTLQLVDTSRTMWANSAEKAQSLRTHASVAIINFSVEVTSVELRARLLPSLLAKYRLDRAISSGVTGEAANWTASIDSHQAEFCVSSEGKPMDTFTLGLPAVAVNGQYTVDKGDAPHTNKQLLYREGGYLKMTLTLGQVNHSFTTDLLNQILFAEQSFRSELSALIQRIRGEQSVYSPASTQIMNVEDKPQLLFFLTVEFEGIVLQNLNLFNIKVSTVTFGELQRGDWGDPNKFLLFSTRHLSVVLTGISSLSYIECTNHKIVFTGRIKFSMGIK